MISVYRIILSFCFSFLIFLLLETSGVSLKHWISAPLTHIPPPSLLCPVEGCQPHFPTASSAAAALNCWDSSLWAQGRQLWNLEPPQRKINAHVLLHTSPRAPSLLISHPNHSRMWDESTKTKSRTFELGILPHNKFWFVFPHFSSFVTLGHFPSDIQAFHCSHKGRTLKTTNRQTKKTQPKTIKQNKKSPNERCSHCSCRWGLEKAAGKTRIRIKKGGSTEYRTWCSAAQGQVH